MLGVTMASEADRMHAWQRDEDGEPVRVRTWRFLRGTGLERCELRSAADGWRLRGSLVLHDGTRSAEAHYVVACDTAWRTRRMAAVVRDGAGERSLELEVEGERWLERGRELEAVRGCIDVDLGWSPSTNTLPIRRLGLAPGAASGLVRAAWVRFPELSVSVLPQEYVRLGERRYRYTSNGGAFTAELEVDELGLVVDYGGVWERVGSDG
jgi:uncharacterized protein